jgi:serine/threonine-protein kinase
MGAVYEARLMGPAGFEKTVALKTILEDVAGDPEFVEMFIGEAKLVADLVHQNIVQMYHLGKVAKSYYIAMEYIEGVNLEEFIERHFQLGREVDVEIACFIAAQMCHGLEYAHTKRDRAGNVLGVVHRDISPKNAMITTLGVIKVTDFGIAKARNLMRDREGEVLMGKVQYMSPEQAQFQSTDRRSDIFSSGIVFYEMLSGENVFADADTMICLNNVVKKKIPPIREMNRRVPAEVERILERALERDVNRRYQSAAEMARDLEKYMYSNRFGPTNVVMERYLKDLFPELAQKTATVRARRLTSAQIQKTVVITEDDVI